jgi:hypothetical protein
MSINIGVGLITGVMLGFEYAYVEDTHHVLIDFLFVRFVIEIE